MENFFFKPKYLKFFTLNQILEILMSAVYVYVNMCVYMEQPSIGIDAKRRNSIRKMEIVHAIRSRSNAFLPFPLLFQAVGVMTASKN